jgi:hypothetical protein
MRHYFAIVLIAVLLSVSSWLGAVHPAAAQIVTLVPSCKGWPSETVLHWDSAEIEHAYGHGIHIVRADFRWNIYLQSQPHDIVAKIDGDNARAVTPIFAVSAQAAVLFSDGSFYQTGTVDCS